MASETELSRRVRICYLSELLIVFMLDLFICFAEDETHPYHLFSLLVTNDHDGILGFP